MKAALFFAMLLFSVTIVSSSIMGMSSQAQMVSFLNSTVNVTIDNNGTHTQFLIMANVGLDDLWIAAGFNAEPKMTNTDQAVCRYDGIDAPSVLHYYNPVTIVPQLVSETEPAIGFSNTSVSITSQTLMCYFVRQNVIDSKNLTGTYFQLESEGPRPYLIVAYGEGNIGYHFANRAASVSGIELAVPIETTTTTATASTTVQTTTPQTAIVSFFEQFTDIINWIIGLLTSF